MFHQGTSACDRTDVAMTRGEEGWEVGVWRGFFEHARMQQGRRQAASVKNCCYVTLFIRETDVQLLSWQIQFFTTFLCWHCLLLVPYGHTRYIILISFVNLIHIFQVHFIYSKLFWYKLCLHFLLCRYTREELRNRVVVSSHFTCTGNPLCVIIPPLHKHRRVESQRCSSWAAEISRLRCASSVLLTSSRKSFLSVCPGIS